MSIAKSITIAGNEQFPACYSHECGDDPDCCTGNDADDYADRRWQREQFHVTKMCGCQCDRDQHQQ
ncbi:hypothetical protein ACFVWF_28935 [Rhodococcus qingshengii]|uniref:hypothetical protein n=1 Tax=Rhodococcus qingshengii TaxID=334542 RepID=UPI0036D9D747